MNESTEEDKNRDKNLNILNAPLSVQGVPVWMVMVLMVIGMIYLLNPTAGLLELIPDTLPFVGNLDDATAAILVWKGLQEIIEGRKYRRQAKGKGTDK